MDDGELLRQYADSACPRPIRDEAFALLVRRHIDFVYASARRMTGDAHLAEDIAQGVFIVLARKARRVRSAAVLPAWLHAVTRNVSANLTHAQSRRRHHEQKAAAMKNASCDDSQVRTEEDDRALAGALDDALSRLGTQDRGAVVMRYLQGKSILDVATAMEISEEAARKRVQRAVQRMRDYFQRQGVAIDEFGMILRMARQAQQVAPASLAPLVAAKSLSSTAASVGWIGKLVGLSSSMKIATAACVCLVAGAGIVAAVETGNPVTSAKPQAGGAVPPVVALSAPQMWQPYVPSDAPGTDVLKIPNDELLTNPKNNIPDYFGGLDDKVHRGEGPPAASVRSLAVSPQKNGIVYKKIPADPYRGKRIRLAGYLKSQDVSQQASMALWVSDSKGYALSQDDMGGHWLTGTTDWTRYDIVEDVPAEADQIVVIGTMRGTGAIWLDDLELSVVDPKLAAVNDDHRWRSWTLYPLKYSTTFDEHEQRNNHGTICVSSTSAAKSDWNCYDHTIDDVTPYRGKRLKLSAMLKARDVTNFAGPQIRIIGVNNSTAKMDEMASRRPVRGSPDWLKYSTLIDVPRDAMGLSFGVIFFGPGTIWIDDLKLEVVK